MQLSPNQLTLLHVKNIGKVNVQSCSIILKKTKLFFININLALEKITQLVTQLHY